MISDQDGSLEKYKNEPQSVFDLFPVRQASQVFSELVTLSKKNVKKKTLKLQNMIKWPSRNVLNLIQG